MHSSEDPDERWLDEHAGRLVRPYVITGGRIVPVRGEFDLISLILATRPVPADEPGFGPEHVAIVELCEDLLSVAEIAAQVDLPVGTVRVVLGDLLHGGFITVRAPEPEVNMSDERMYEAVLDGLRAL
ncbi:MAG: hypothetical protein JWO67_1206 [Streptosporangiaceae bacterium]|nr:hypothetical protein [Streptosporangiaceae bacterium]